MPETAVDAEIARISQRVRRWRESEGLTLQGLAQRSGVATSTIQKVETGQMTPSVAILLKIARGLNRAASDFIHETDCALDLVHLREASRPKIGPPDGNHLERMSAELRDPALEMWRVSLLPDSSGGKQAIRYQGEAVLVCEKGRPTLEVGGETIVMAAGDTLHFKANLGFRWRNDGNTKAVFTITGTLPDELRASIQGRLATNAVRSKAVNE
jgi:transcriptional regulator with XRE-family HTH domain